VTGSQLDERSVIHDLWLLVDLRRLLLLHGTPAFLPGGVVCPDYSGKR
jgi:hypothetical protein